jgi:hypothetical protein
VSVAIQRFNAVCVTSCFKDIHDDALWHTRPTMYFVLALLTALLIYIPVVIVLLNVL